MGLPGIPKIDIDIKGTVTEFLDLLREMNSKLDTLIDLQRSGTVECDKCEQMGRLRCPLHGPVRVPTLDASR